MSVGETQLGDVAAKIELGGTNNPAAFDAYLRGARLLATAEGETNMNAAISAFTDAIRLDPHYALAFAARARARTTLGGIVNTVAESLALYDKAQADARQSLKLAPNIAEGHLTLASALQSGLNYAQAKEEYERALVLSPGNAQVLRLASRFEADIGYFDSAIEKSRRAVALDPLDRTTYFGLGGRLYFGRRHQEAVAAYAEAIRLDPDYKVPYAMRGLAYYELGDLERARTDCEAKKDHFIFQVCLALVYEKLGRTADAKMELEKLKAVGGDSAAYQYAEIYAQWGDTAKALDWLEVALRVRDPGLTDLKADPLLDPLRQEPRYQAIESQLRFPN